MMGQIMIRNLDATVIEALRRRAAACGTSMEEQARRALTRAVGLEREAATLDDLRARPWPRLGMTVIVDASVALKWVIEEDGSEAAGALLLEEPLAAPDLLIVECANVLWAKARRGHETTSVLMRRTERRDGPHEAISPRRVRGERPFPLYRRERVCGLSYCLA